MRTWEDETQCGQNAADEENAAGEATSPPLSWMRPIGLRAEEEAWSGGEFRFILLMETLVLS